MLSNDEVKAELEYMTDQRDIEDTRVKQALLILCGSMYADELLDELVDDMVSFANRIIEKHKHD